MRSSVLFRDFELRDVDFIYRAKNDRRLCDTIIGDYTTFSYEDAVEWVKGCMVHDVNYKFWAICSNDEFQNIVGWCGISDVDKKNRSANFRTLNVCHPKYRDTITWYNSWMFVLEYVFNELDFNRLTITSLASNKFHYQFLDFFPKSYEGTMRQALFKNGKFVDVAFFGVIKDEYEECKRQGLLDFNVIQNFLKEKLRREQTPFQDINDFITIFKKELDSTDPQLITPETKFRDLEEWSSLFAINIVAIAEGGFQTQFDMNELGKCDTIKDLYELVKARSSYK